MSDTPKPTIDERIAAIAKSLELFSLEARERFSKLEAVMNLLAEAQLKTDVRLDRLIRVVARHEQQLDAFEG